jgi:hypothetical protein
MPEAAPDRTERETPDPHPAPGDSQGVAVPHDQALEGSSEQFRAVQGIYRPEPDQDDELPRSGDHKELP